MIRVFGCTRQISKGSLTTFVRMYCPQSDSKAGSSEQHVPDVPGLSKKCVDVPNEPVGPCAAKDKDYKNPEYFCYNSTSFAEAEVEMEKYRLPTPTNKEKFKRNLP